MMFEIQIQISNLKGRDLSSTFVHSSANDNVLKSMFRGKQAVFVSCEAVTMCIRQVEQDVRLFGQ